MLARAFLTMAVSSTRHGPRAATLLRGRHAYGCGASTVYMHSAAASTPANVADLCLIDGHALAYRMHFALMRTGMTTVAGEHSHAIHGFLSKILDVHGLYPQHRVAVAFDLPGATFRTIDQPSYKSKRPSMPTPLRPQIEGMKEGCAHFGLSVLTAEGFEADDVIATCVANAREAGVGSVVIVGCDKDLMQLVSEEGAPTRVIMWNDQKKIVVDAAAVSSQFGVRPAQLGDLLALMGDASDNVPGVPGVGPKGAAKLLADYADLESVLQAAASMKPSKRTTALLEFAETARRARALVTLRTDVPLDGAAARGGCFDFANEELLQFLRRWELKSVEAKVHKLRRMEMQRHGGPVVREDV